MRTFERAKKLLNRGAWKQLPWRIRGAIDASGRVESSVIENLPFTKYPAIAPLFMGPHGHPLKILLIAMRGDYGSRRRGLSYEEVHFARCLKQLGYPIFHFDFMRVARRHGRQNMNRILREAAAAVSPDLAFCILFSDEIGPETIRFMRNIGIKTFNWFCDDQWRYEGFSRYWAPEFDHVSTTSRAAYSRYIAEGHGNVFKTQWGFNPFLFEFCRQPRTHDESIDVLFVGQPHGNRRELVDLLRKRGVSVVTRGYGWPEGRVTFAEMVALLREAKVVLGLSNSWDSKIQQVKGRDFEVPASGALHLTATNDELDEYFLPDSEVATYSSAADLVEKTRYFLSDSASRRSVAMAGQQRAWREHTYISRFETVFLKMGFTKQDTDGDLWFSHSVR